MVRRLARRVLSISAVFLMVMAILINSPALFYMATAMIATIGACALQAWLSVRGLRIERIAPPAVSVGDVVTVSMVVWSDRRIKRPLIVVRDRLPSKLRRSEETPSLPIAPAFDQPIQTSYSFRAMRRGRFSWTRVEVEGTDTLGLVSMNKDYPTEPTELMVYPSPISVNFDLRPTGGSGVSEAESGRYRGSGIEPRGIREYQPGDPQRYVHWASSSRSRTLMVKEFESGAGLRALFFFQRKNGSDLGETGFSSFEVACGHVKYLTEQFLRLGSQIEFPGLERGLVATDWDARRRQIDEILTSVNADQSPLLSDEIRQQRSELEKGGSVYLLLSIQDSGLAGLIASNRNCEWNCLIYDSVDFGVSHQRVNSAADPAFLRELEAAGARVFVMPEVHTIIKKRGKNEAS